MKTNITGKYKWYLIAIIAAVLIMSIGLSFCTWDTISIDKIADIKGGTADFKYLPEWAPKAVSDDFIDNKGMRWLVVDKTTANGKTNMVLMTYYVTAQRAYELSGTNPDYNSTLNNIRGYLNDIWYKTLDPVIQSYVVPKTIGYKEGTIFPRHVGSGAEKPSVTPVVATKDNKSWIASFDEVGLTLVKWGLYLFNRHDGTFQHFAPSKDVWFGTSDYGASTKKKASPSAGAAAVNWWTRTGYFSHAITIVGANGGFNGDINAYPSANNYMRPCVEVQFQS